MENKSEEKTLRAEALEKGQDLGKSAVKIAWWSVFIYPVSTVAGMIGGGAGAYFLAAPHVGGLLTFLGVIAGLALGAVAGFFTGGFIVSSLIGDLIFDAGWQTTKLGWKAARRKSKKRKA